MGLRSGFDYGLFPMYFSVLITGRPYKKSFSRPDVGRLSFIGEDDEFPLCPQIFLIYGKSIMHKKLYQYTEVCTFLKSRAYVIWISVVVVSGVTRWECARTSQRNMEKSGVHVEGKKKRPES